MAQSLLLSDQEGLLLYASPITPELLALPDRFPDDRDNSAADSSPVALVPDPHETLCDTSRMPARESNYCRSPRLAWR